MKKKKKFRLHDKKLCYNTVIYTVYGLFYVVICTRTHVFSGETSNSFFDVRERKLVFF